MDKSKSEKYSVFLYSFTVDNNLRIKRISKGLEEICGRSLAEVRGLPYHEIFPRIRVGKSDGVKKALATGSHVTVKKHRTPCFFGAMESDVTICPQKDGDGNMVGAHVRIAPCLLCEASKESQKSRLFIEIGKKASSLAHGVRNPLNAIKGSVVYIREKYPKEKELVEFTQLIEEEIYRLDTFISKFLSASLVDKDEASETDINSLLRKVEKLINLQTQSHKIQSSFQYGDIARVMVNPFHLEQGILNVINNAIEAMSGEGQLVVKTHNENLPSGHFAVIEVLDTGPGMAESRSHKKAATTGDKGRGFGMILTREALRRYGGYLAIKRRAGATTVVKLYLPCKPG